jgi:hypothetical protein
MTTGRWRGRAKTWTSPPRPTASVTTRDFQMAAQPLQSYRRPSETYAAVTVVASRTVDFISVSNMFAWVCSHVMHSRSGTHVSEGVESLMFAIGTRCIAHDARYGIGNARSIWVLELDYVCHALSYACKAVRTTLWRVSRFNTVVRSRDGA